MPAFTIPSFAWPIVIDSSNDVIEMDEGGAAFDADVADGTYFWRGDGSAADMCTALDTALTAASLASGAGLAFTVTLLSPGFVQISATGDFNLNWGAGDADRLTYGFDAGNTGLASACKSDFQVGRAWFPETERIDDTRDVPLYEASQQRMADGSVDTQEWSEYFVRDVLIDRLLPRKIFQAEEVVGQEQEAWRQGVGGEERPSLWWASGERFEYCPDFASRAGVLTNPGTRETYKPREDLEEPNIVITAGTVDRYDVLLRMQYYVA